MNSMKCVLCGAEAASEHFAYAMYYRVSCRNCLNYNITRAAHDDIRDDNKSLQTYLPLVSGFFRELHERELPQERPFELRDVKTILSHPWVPKSVGEKADKLLLHIDRLSTYFAEPIDVDFETPAIAYCVNNVEISNLFHALKEKGLIDTSGQASKTDAGKARLTLEGAIRAEKLKVLVPDSQQCFVAMWFDESMKAVFDDYIFSAAEKTGFYALRIDNKEHNDDICDKIIGEIRKSRFLIADFTGLRPGVYYPAFPKIYTYNLKKPYR